MDAYTLRGIPRRRSLFRSLWTWAIVTLVAATTIPLTAAKAQPLFSATKMLCLGTPGTVNPLNCTGSGGAPANTPVFYVFQVTDPPGSPQQIITISETAGPGSSAGWPPGFVLTGINCSVPASSGITTISFVLQMNATVTCTAAGYFTTPSNSVANTAVVSSNQSASSNIYWNNSVTSSAPLGTDIGIQKLASTSFVTAPGSIIYTVTITNNGPNAVNLATLAPLFTFHDNLALLPSSVPLNATLTNWLCTATGVSACLTPSPSSVNSPLLVGTSAPHPFFDWSFSPGATGQWNVGGQIVLTYTVQYTAIPGLNCKKLPGNPDGLSNTGFFTLANGNSAAYDTNSGNNTSTANVTVDTGATIVNPNCGDGQLSLKKIQTNPLTSPVAWGTPVSYDLIIQNTSIPAQPIRIAAAKITDWVTEGVNTPPFSRRFVAPAGCNSNQPGLCAAVMPGNGTVPFQYSYYGQTDQGWSGPSAPLIVLNYNKILTLHLTFIYENPDCDAVPLANPKPIDNTEVVDYMATALGAPLNSPPAQFHQTSTVTTYMEPPKTCQFAVTKKLIGGGPNVHFGGPPLVYRVTFTNNDAPRTIGTVADMLRITDPNYATPLGYSAIWTCTQTGGVTGFSTLPTTATGQAIYTGAPSQGAIVFTQPTSISQPPLYFPHNSTLSCTVAITVTRPPYGSPNCSSTLTDLENLGIMDPTRPYNPSGFWPPSGTYNPANTINPPTQDKNWATVRTPLPKCFDLIVNKSASVAGVSPPWTYVGGPAIDYTITATNPTGNLLTGQLSGSTWNGLILTDSVGPPYNNSVQTVLPPCTPLAIITCAGIPAAPPTQAIGIASLAAQQSGDWHLTVVGTAAQPFVAGQSVNNCAHVKISGDYANPNDWYPNFDPNQPAPNAQTSCVSVPVLDTRPLRVLKRIVNNTGATIYLAAPPTFAVQVSCSPYSLSASQSSGTITMPAGSSMVPNGGSAVGGPWISPNVPVADQCNVTETAPPLPVLLKRPCPSGMALQWFVSYSPAQPITISATAANLVTVINTLQCVPVPSSNLTIVKVFQNATILPAVPFPAQTFYADVTCAGQAPLTGIPLVTPATTSTSPTSSSPPNLVFSGLPLGTQCNVQENPNPPPMPAIAYKICRAHNYGLPAWAVSIVPSQPFNLANGNNVVTIYNKAYCMPFPHAPLDVTKVFKNLTGSTAVIGPLSFPVQVLCTNTPTTNLLLQTPATSTTSTSAQGVVPNALVGGVCIASETPSTAGLSSYCVTNGAPGTPYWVTTYSPSATVPINASGNTMQIENDLMCSPILVVTKEFDDATGGIYNMPQQSFGIQVNCAGASPASQTLQTPGTTPSNPSSTSAPWYLSAGLAVGAQCQVTENPSPPPIPTIAYKSCKTGDGGGVPFWTTTFSLGSTVNLGAGINQLLVKNVLGCGPPTKARLDLVKIFNNQTLDPQALATQSGPITFNVAVNCSDGTNFTQGLTTPPTATQSTSGPVQTSNVIIGATCNFNESTPPIPNGAMQACMEPTGVQDTPTWQMPPTYSPPTTTIVAGGVTETITNTLTCVPPPSHRPQGGKPPAVHGGINSGGAETEPQPQCDRAPSVNGEPQPKCKCPEGTHRKSGTCVKKKSVLDDVLGHVTIGVGVGVGSGGGSEKPKSQPKEQRPNGQDGR